jgi:hypothetical protein
MKINLKLYFFLTAINLYYFFIFNELPSKYGLWFSIGFFAAMAINQLMLVKMVQLMVDDGKSGLTFVIAVSKFLVLIAFFYVIGVYYADIALLSIVSYVFQLIILVISIKRYVSKIRNKT